MSRAANEVTGVLGGTQLTDPDGRLIICGPNGGAVQTTTGVSAASTATLTNVASSASSVTVLAANTSREGATVYNDSTQVLYLKMGATASATSYTVQLASNAYYEVPFGYNGKLDGLWASANGSARVTELTA